MGTVEGSYEALEEGKALAEGRQVQRCGAVTEKETYIVLELNNIRITYFFCHISPRTLFFILFASYWEHLTCILYFTYIFCRKSCLK